MENENKLCLVATQATTINTYKYNAKFVQVFRKVAGNFPKENLNQTYHEVEKKRD